MTPSLIVIAAIARNGVIGRGNALVWRDPVDAKHFRAVTMGSPVVMGRKTWDSLPPKFKPLPGRLNLVVTRDPLWRAEGAQKSLGLLDALAQAQQASSAGSTLNPTHEASISAAPGTHPSTAPRTYVIGGAQLYAQALPLADELVHRWGHSLSDVGSRSLRRSAQRAARRFARHTVSDRSLPSTRGRTCAMRVWDRALRREPLTH
jgi:dihydrofolate reductase